MAAIASKRRRGDEDVRRPKKKIRVKQKSYHSSSEDEDEDEEDLTQQPREVRQVSKSILKQRPAVKQAEEGDDEDFEIEGLDDLDEAERNAALNAAQAADDDDDDLESDAEADGPEGDLNALSDSDPDEDDNDEYDIDSLSQTSSQTPSTASGAAKKKRHDPDAFATSISKILDTKLSSAKRPDPILSRSKTAAEANKSIQDSKLDAAARAQIRAERKKALDKGRVVDLLGLEDEGVDTGGAVEEEKRLRKIAQRGVVRLFNAVRAAQVGAERAARGEDGETAGRKAREERVSEMSKEGFLEMISKGRAGVTT